MDARLQPIYERTVQLLQADPRVLAAYMTGSVGTPREDEYSDVDPVFVIQADRFDELDRDLPSLFAQAGVEPFLWWPERINTATFRNYAVLFVVDGQPAQYDISIAACPADGRRPILSGQFIFDKANVLEVLPPAAASEQAPQRLGWHVEIFWIYAYIHAKYLRRGDPFRLAAAQQELLQAHLAILQALYPGVKRQWWPIMAAEFAEERAALLTYLESPVARAVAARLPAQLRTFAEHAQAACRRRSEGYPMAAEDGIRRYVETVAASIASG